MYLATVYSKFNVYLELDMATVAPNLVLIAGNYSAQPLGVLQGLQSFTMVVITTE